MSGITYRWNVFQFELINVHVWGWQITQRGREIQNEWINSTFYFLKLQKQKKTEMITDNSTRLTSHFRKFWHLELKHFVMNHDNNKPALYIPFTWCKNPSCLCNVLNKTNQHWTASRKYDLRQNWIELQNVINCCVLKFATRASSELIRN